MKPKRVKAMEQVLTCKRTKTIMKCSEKKSQEEEEEEEEASI